MKSNRNVVLGAFLVLSLLGLTILTWRLAGLTLKPRQQWVAYFGRDSVVEEGFEVFTSGMKVGMVERVEPVPDADVAEGRHVKAVLTVDTEITLWKGAELVLAPRSLLGGLRAELHRGEIGTRQLPPTTPLPGRVEGGVTEQIAQMVSENRESIRKGVDALAEAAVKMNSGEGTVARLLNEDEAARKLEEAADSFRAVADDIRELLRANRENLDRIVKDTQEVIEKVNTGKGTVARLLNEDTAIVKLEKAADRIDEAARQIGGMVDENRAGLRETIERLSNVARKVDSGEGVLAKLLNDQSLANDLETIASNLTAFSENINAVAADFRMGKGTLGKLFVDEGAYEQLMMMLQSFREGGEVARENAPLGSLTSFTSLFFNVLN